MHRPNTNRRADRRDRGTTLVELTVTIVLLAVLTLAAATGISVVFRSEDSINGVVGRAHDLQQTVNYFPSDVQSGPLLRSSYRIAGDANLGTGCNPVGNTNLLRINSGNLSVVYTVGATVSGTYKLDRHECSLTPAPYSTLRVRNIADDLVGVNAAAAAKVTIVNDAAPNAANVRGVTIQLQRTTGAVEVMASPRVESRVAAAIACTNDPLAATLGFQSFAEGDVTLTGGTQVYGALGVGGKLTIAGTASVGQNVPINNAAFQPAGTILYVNEVNWGASSATLTVPGGPNHAVIVNQTNTKVTKSGNISTIKAITGSQTPSIKIDNGDLKAGVTPVDFAAQFVRLRACATMMGALPSSCTSCAAQVTLRNENDNGPYTGSGGTKVRLNLTNGKTNVLNITAARLNTIVMGDFAGTVRPTATAPLIINVIDSGTINFKSFSDGVRNYPKFVIWNFPKATTVNISGPPNVDGVWGTVFAPSANVVSSVNIQGGVVAKSYSQNGGVVNISRILQSTISWN